MTWFEDLKSSYTRGEASVFILHGNVHDLFQIKGSSKTGDSIDGNFYVNLTEFLISQFEKSKNLILTYNLAQGLVSNQDSTIALTYNPIRYVEDKLITQAKTAVIFDYAETIFPYGDNFLLNETERTAVVAAHRWAGMPSITEKDNLVILITENLSQIADKLKTEPRIGIIEIPMPDEGTRREVIAPHISVDESDEQIGMSLDSKIDYYVTLTSALKIVQILPLVTNELDLNRISKEKKEIINRECAGLLELINPHFGFEAVSGIPEIKKELSEIAKAMKEGNINRVPMGVLFTGAMGTGKTFTAEAFAKECGIPLVKLANFKDRWVGSSEANLERILRVIKALGQVIVVIDEADRAIGNDQNSGDPTASPLKAMLKEFMSDTSNRGKVLFLLMSNRPDLIDVDLKRAGRIDLKIPFFYAETEPEIRNLLRVAFTQLHTVNPFKDPMNDSIFAKFKGYSNADISEVARLSINGDPLSVQKIISVLDDYFPTRDIGKVELMELLAVFECSSKRFIPERLKALAENPSALSTKISSLKFMLDGER